MSEWKEKIIAEEPYGEGNELKHFRYVGDIVRCRDCKNIVWMEEEHDVCECQVVYGKHRISGFCAWGERKDG